MSDLNIVLDSDEISISETTDQLELTVIRGDRGPQGPSGIGLETADFNATENIPAFTVVTIDGHRANSNNPVSDRGRVIGVSEAAVLSGFIGTAITGGEITNPSWSWTPGTKLFLNGQNISAAAPGTGFSQFIGTARNAQTIIVQLGPPILC